MLPVVGALLANATISSISCGATAVSLNDLTLRRLLKYSFSIVDIFYKSTKKIKMLHLLA
jgi:hypothetical protein